MPDVRIEFEPDNVHVRLSSGAPILVAARKAGVPIEAVCGGKGRCGKCRCRIAAGQVVEQGDQRAVLGEAYDEGLRLACRTRVLSDAIIVVPEASRLTRPKILEQASFSLAGRSPDPGVCKIYLELPPPSLGDQRADLDRLLDGLAERGVSHPAYALSRIGPGLPDVLRQADFRVTAILDGNQLIGVEPGDTTDAAYGVALDVGTTTVVGYLVNLQTGQRLNAASTINGQVQYGDDVVSRITFLEQNPGGLRRLQAAVLDDVNKIIGELAAEAGIPRERIYRIVAVGNATMNHLFLGIPPSAIARTPYVPAVQQGTTVTASDFGIRIAPGGEVHWLPNIAGWVGADTVGVILATGIHRSPEVWLAIDIGTNGEIVLGNRDTLLACSCAAGPAFEGAQIRQGMRGADGAVDHVDFVNGHVAYSTIGRAVPRGICGSGLLDVAAGLRRLGLVDEAGHMARPEQAIGHVPEAVARRLGQAAGETAFVIVPEHESALDEPISLTQRDIRQLQLAKGAIAAGIQVLLKEAALKASSIRRVLLAGAFGTYVRHTSAADIGLFPPELVDRAESVGNAAGAGAYLALVSREAAAEAEVVARRVRYIELARRSDFDEAFAEAMLFPDVAGEEFDTRLAEV